MLKSDRYIITPFLNNSFDSSMKELIKFVVSEYKLIYELFDFGNITYSLCCIDKTTVGSNFSNMKTPDIIYISVNFMNEGSWTNSGGLIYCTIILNFRTKIEVRWDTSPRGYNYEYFNITKLRRLKLEKLNEINEI
jgi:hypothetical protein